MQHPFLHAHFTLSLLAIAVSLHSAPARSEVEARYLRIEAPASYRMALNEIELVSGDGILPASDILRIYGQAIKQKTFDSPASDHMLFDGEMGGRPFNSDAVKKNNPWIEVDLGRERSIDRIVIHQLRKPTWNDRGLRLVSLLDDDRQVVYVSTYDVRDEINQEQRVELNPPQRTNEALLGKIIPAGSDSWVVLSDVVQVLETPDPPNAAQRLEAFNNRNRPESIRQLADEFFLRVDLDQPHLTHIRDLYEAGDAQGALDAFRDYFFAEKLSGLSNWSKVNSAAFGPRYEGQADDLMAGVAVSFEDKHLLGKRFKPGLIHWAYTSDDPVEALEQIRVIRKWSMVNYLPGQLLVKYAETGEQDYMDAWAEISDDWAMHFAPQADASDDNLRGYLIMHPLGYLYAFLAELNKLRVQRPELVDAMPSATLARVLMMPLQEYLPTYWRQGRKLSFNHTFNGLSGAYKLTEVLNDFYAGQRLEREVAQHFERLYTFHMTRDGSMIEVNGDIGHMYMPKTISHALRSMQSNAPSWLTPERKNRIINRQKDFHLLNLRDRAPDAWSHRWIWKDAGPGLWRIRGDDPTKPYGSADGLEVSETPGYLDNPDVRKYYDTVLGRGRDYDKNPGRYTRKELNVRKKMQEDIIAELGSDSYEGPPGYTSDFLPYTGLVYLRDSWDPDAMFLHATAQPMGSYDTNIRTINTMFRFVDFGSKLLTAQPITINGQEQLQMPEGFEKGLRKVRPGSKTGRIESAPHDPIEARWLSTDRFDFAEGFYRGIYQNYVYTADPEPGQSRWTAGQPELTSDSQEITDVRTVRQFMLLRPYRLMIVTDRVAFPDNQQKEYEYRMNYTMFVEAAENKKSKAVSGRVSRDADAGRITLENSNLPTMQVWHFGAEELHYTDGGIGAHPRKSDIPYDYQGLDVKWQGRGDQAVVTLLEAHTDQVDRRIDQIMEINTDKVTGFDATTKDNGRISYRAAASSLAQVGFGSIQAEGEALLLVGSPHGITGMALGMKRMSVNGQPITLEHSDFQFTLQGQDVVDIVPILKPINPVRVQPQQQVFVDEMQVTLETSTPEVDIRYTTDGTKPTGESTLYDGPFTIGESTQILARAFRKGVTEVPFVLNGTQVSAISYGWFEKRTLLPATDTVSNLEPGLNYDYLEGNWFSLYSYADLLKPVRQGTTTELMDVSPRQTDGPFGMRYTGFLRVPETGIYTFYGPEEFVKMIAEPGYDLRLWIDGQQWYLGQTWHGQGQWSVPLEKGNHEIRVTFADARARDIKNQRSDQWGGFPRPWVVWKGKAPAIDVSGPGIERQPIPNEWFYRMK